MPGPPPPADNWFGANTPEKHIQRVLDWIAAHALPVVTPPTTSPAPPHVPGANDRANAT